jgi:hypothetical protein
MKVSSEEGTVDRKKLQTVSIVLEWETVEEGGVGRAERGLREVCRQITELQDDLRAPAEVLVCYEERVVSEPSLRSIVERAAGPEGWSCPVLLVPVPPGTNYYEKKNTGARQSKNDVIVFLDSDLIPDSGWLRNIMTPFDDWSVSVLTGATHLDHASTYEMAVALSWIFPPATYGRGIQPFYRYSSNNLAFRRALFLRFPFPAFPTYRGQCGDLGKTLRNAGIAIPEQTDARTTHPPPAGVRGFVHRAFAAGKDEQFYASLEAETSIGSVWRQLMRDYGVVARRVRERRALLKPEPVAEALGWLLGWTYYGIKAVGYLSHVSRRTARDRAVQALG